MHTLYSPEANLPSDGQTEVKKFNQDPQSH